MFAVNLRCYLLTEWIASPACIAFTLVPCRNHVTPYMLCKERKYKVIQAGSVSSGDLPVPPARAGFESSTLVQQPFLAAALPHLNGMIASGGNEV